MTDHLTLTCRLDECPPGLFICGGGLGFKSEYRTEKGLTEAFVLETGEFFWGGTKTNDEREALMVLPVQLTALPGLRCRIF